MSNTDSGTGSHWKAISFLLVGILIPLATAALPWLLENVFVGDSLKYSFQGPVVSKEDLAFEISVQNEGRKTQNDVEVWIPLRIIKSFSAEAKDGARLIDKGPQITIDSSVPPDQVEELDERRVLKFSALRPNESLTISVFVLGGGALLSSYDLEKLRVVSSETVGVYLRPSEEIFFLYRTGAWLLVAFVLAVISYGIYYDYFMPLAKKEKYLMEQIDKLEKRK